ncbi:hypothetical protein RGK87_04695 [Agrobacterium fabacearum]|uniref:hypothetical protein n=1 Tax=Agrobacterium tumefaciens TaxID=358 RepID=UPI0028532E0D|nr:hypothetical protein [Agrobacterium tumefaciens]MDR5008305.1 hypothetical protein [Agrobacterium tumefaciens]
MAKPLVLTEKKLIAMSPDMVSAINDWRFKNRVNTESEAVRRLLAFALNAQTELAPYVTIAHNGLEYDQRKLIEKIIGLLRDTHPVGHYFGHDTENPSEEG